MAIIQVIGSLIKKPELLLEDAYVLKNIDFPESFHQIVFSAIHNLVNTGVKELDVITIDNYISQYEKQYAIYNTNDGIQYIEKCIELANIQNFKYYYYRLKKFSLLRDFNNRGFDIAGIYDESIIDVNLQEQMQQTFDEMTLKDIITYFESQIIEVKTEFCEDENQKGQQAGKGMMKLKENYKLTPEMGIPLQSKILTTITRGARLKTFYMRSMPSGEGKTRLACADACAYAVPYYYDTNINQWIKNTFSEPTLFITTELEIDEIQTLFMAYVSGVNEAHILDGKYEKGEEERVDKAIEYIEKSPLYIEHIPNFNIEDIKDTIKKHKVQHNIGYVSFDYIHTSTKILIEMGKKAKGIRIREDNVLTLFTSEMKNLAINLNVHIDSASQLNGEWENTKNGNQNLLRGAKAMADKLDVGIIGLPVTQIDLKALSPILAKNFNQKVPNLVYHIYKVRRGKFVKVKLWLYVDLGTCRTEDLFLTDNDYKVLDIEATDVEKILEDNIDNDDNELLISKGIESEVDFQW